MSLRLLGSVRVKPLCDAALPQLKPLGDAALPRRRCPPDVERHQSLFRRAIQNKTANSYVIEMTPILDPRPHVRSISV
jgi:hypothetical protein